MSNTTENLSFFGVDIVKSIDDFPKITLYYEDFRPEIFAMYQAITNLGYWNKLKDFEPGEGGFMFCKDPEWLQQIRSDPSVYKCGHSGASMAMTFRCMQFIAQNGWEKFVMKYNEK